MDNHDLHNCICEITNETFRRMSRIYIDNKQGRTITVSRLVFPHYRNSDKLRISEQELRFVFVEVFNQYCDENELDLFYSIETPSFDSYDFSRLPRRCDHGKSAMFDLVIFDENYKRRALIEFKANNAGWKDHEKDFVKLSNRIENEESIEVLRYFIEIVDNYDRGTISSLSSKIKNSGSTVIKVYSLKKNEYIEIC